MGFLQAAASVDRGEPRGASCPLISRTSPGPDFLEWQVWRMKVDKAWPETASHEEGKFVAVPKWLNSFVQEVKGEVACRGF